MWLRSSLVREDGKDLSETCHIEGLENGGHSQRIQNF